MSQSDWTRVIGLLRDRPDSPEALELGFSALQTPPETDEVVEQLERLAEESAAVEHRLLLAEALHLSGRFDDSARVLRDARRSGPSTGHVDALLKRFPPRYTERLRFYACNRAVGVEGREVLEIGGRLPRGFVAATSPARWTCVDLGIEQESEEGFYRLLPGDAAELPLADECVDLVFSSSAFEHISNLGAALREMARVLRPGGTVFSDFSPIWSSAHGHHIRGKAREVLRAAGMWPLEPWFHLTRTRREMREYLGERLSAEDQRVVERWLYRRPSLNRLFYEDYIHLFHASPLKVRRLDLKTGGSPDEETLRLLARRQPGRSSFHVSGFRAILRK